MTVWDVTLGVQVTLHKSHQKSTSYNDAKKVNILRRRKLIKQLKKTMFE